MLARQSRPSDLMPRASSQAGSTATSFNSDATFGFSKKPTTLPLASTRMMPREPASLRLTGLPAIVTSASVALCVASISRKSMR